MEGKTQVVLAGLPGAGKTTFLAALWQVLESHEVTGALNLASEPNDRAYLNEVRTQWAQGANLGRTPVATEEYISFMLGDPDGTTFELVVPDVSGEAFKALWTRGEWTGKLGEFCQAAVGLVVFVHSHDIQPAAGIDQANELIKALPGPSPSTPLEGAKTDLVFNPENAPTATQIVDIIQSVRKTALAKRMPTALIVSAWDLVHTEDDPGRWLKLNLPLVDQCLKANADAHAFEVFGVSALGGDIRNGEERKSLLEKNHPSDRIRVLNQGSSDHDITRPLRWAIRSAR